MRVSVGLALAAASALGIFTCHAALAQPVVVPAGTPSASAVSVTAGVTLEWADGSETSSTGGGSAGVRSFAQTLSVQLRYVPFVNNSTYVFSDEAQAISSSLNTAQSNTTATGATDSISTAQVTFTAVPCGLPVEVGIVADPGVGSGGQQLTSQILSVPCGGASGSVQLSLRLGYRDLAVSFTECIDGTSCEISAHGLEVLVFPRALLDWRPPDSITAADAAFISKVNSKGIARVPFVDSLPVTAQFRAGFEGRVPGALLPPIATYTPPVLSSTIPVYGSGPGMELRNLLCLNSTTASDGPFASVILGGKPVSQGTSLPGVYEVPAPMYPVYVPNIVCTFDSYPETTLSDVKNEVYVGHAWFVDPRGLGDGAVVDVKSHPLSVIAEIYGEGPTDPAPSGAIRYGNGLAVEITGSTAELRFFAGNVTSGIGAGVAYKAWLAPAGNSTSPLIIITVALSGGAYVVVGLLGLQRWRMLVRRNQRRDARRRALMIQAEQLNTRADGRGLTDRMVAYLGKKELQEEICREHLFKIVGDVLSQRAAGADAPGTPVQPFTAAWSSRDGGTPPRRSQPPSVLGSLGLHPHLPVETGARAEAEGSPGLAKYSAPPPMRVSDPEAADAAREVAAVLAQTPGPGGPGSSRPRTPQTPTRPRPSAGGGRGLLGFGMPRSRRPSEVPPGVAAADGPGAIEDEVVCAVCLCEIEAVMELAHRATRGEEAGQGPGRSRAVSRAPSNPREGVGAEGDARRSSGIGTWMWSRAGRKSNPPQVPSPSIAGRAGASALGTSLEPSGDVETGPDAAPAHRASPAPTAGDVAQGTAPSAGAAAGGTGNDANGAAPDSEGSKEDDDREFWLPCGHVFHRACVLEWLERVAVCPVCKRDVRSGLIKHGYQLTPEEIIALASNPTGREVLTEADIPFDAPAPDGALLPLPPETGLSRMAHGGAFARAAAAVLSVDPTAPPMRTRPDAAAHEAPARPPRHVDSHANGGRPPPGRLPPVQDAPRPPPPDAPRPPPDATHPPSLREFAELASREGAVRSMPSGTLSSRALRPPTSQGSGSQAVPPLPLGPQPTGTFAGFAHVAAADPSPRLMGPTDPASTPGDPGPSAGAVPRGASEGNPSPVFGSQSLGPSDSGSQRSRDHPATPAFLSSKPRSVSGSRDTGPTTPSQASAGEVVYEDRAFVHTGSPGNGSVGSGGARAGVMARALSEQGPGALHATAPARSARATAPVSKSTGGLSE